MVMDRAYTFPLLILLACCVTASMANNMNISTDESALLAFKSRMISTIDPANILIKNWSASTPVCVWIGVTCGLRHQRVTALDISSMNLSGNIPSLLGNLSFLVSLNLSRNYFYGSLPRELIQLRRLQIINFRFNSFSGQIPSWFGFLHNLQILNLRNKNFTGFIPPSLSNISTLQTLDLSYNPIQGKIPEEIGNLHNLKTLYLQYNRLTGLIPLTIFNISTLEHLGFTGNNLSGNLPVDICHGLPRLKGLYLSSNELDGEIPSNISECSQLQHLSLSVNKFRGSIPSEIGSIRTLQILYLNSNDLSGSIPPELGNLENLVKLSIVNNFLTGPIPASIFNISSLQYINVARNNLYGSLDLLVLGYELPNLEELYLNSNNFHGRIPNSIANSSKLTEINLAYNNFISESPELSFVTSFTKCRYLINLAFGDNPLNGILPVSVGNLSTSLQYLYAYNCDLWGSIPKDIGNLSSLILLSLFGNQLTGSIPTSVVDLQKLQGLYLYNNKIRGSIPVTLCEHRNLNTLHLSQNLITGAIPDCIGNITTLRLLYIDANRFTSSIPASLWLRNDLLELNLSSNFLSGSLPREIGNLKVAILIDLSVNRFSGSIPSTIGDLQSLINLSIAHNTLQGSIPESMDKLVSMERLDLSYNNLSGNIPKSFEALRYLTYLDVSFNDLSGEVPTGGRFKNFSSQSFMSNEGLCGDPIYGLPPCHTTGPKRRNLKLRVVFVLLGIIVLITIAMALAYAVGRFRRKNLVENTTDFAPRTTLSRVSYYELMLATQGYSENHLLGSGSFGSVYRGTLNDGTDVAVKVFDLQNQNAFKSFDVECEVLRNLRHRNLCKVISTCSNQDFKALVLEYMSNGSLEKWLYSDDCLLDILQRIHIMIDVACALEYLHYGYSTYIVHCDLKPSNVLLDEDMVAHLSDFGIAKLLGEGESNAHTTTMGTLGYIAPEYGLEGSVSIRCDVYSYGIMLMEVFTRTKPSSEIFSGELSLRSWINDSMPNAITRIIDSNLLAPEEEDYTEKLKCLSSIMELALNCSMENANERVNMKDVVVALKKIRIQLLT
ncbi:putative LRR receptor-like serine/threonine-protein kinase [Abeliophyllum distichum]|uniref:non-specific serine/threonine protein kinase n=1 Tax=Abeliophyllum distichum TaxID=126358 RepID=A0ABD1QV28_9LAMI